MSCCMWKTFMIVYLSGLEKGARKPVRHHSCQENNYALRGMNKIHLLLHAAIYTVDLLSCQSVSEQWCDVAKWFN